MQGHRLFGGIQRQLAVPGRCHPVHESVKIVEQRAHRPACRLGGNAFDLGFWFPPMVALVKKGFEQACQHLRRRFVRINAFQQGRQIDHGLGAGGQNRQNLPEQSLFGADERQRRQVAVGEPRPQPHRLQSLIAAQGAGEIILRRDNGFGDTIQIVVGHDLRQGIDQRQVRPVGHFGQNLIPQQPRRAVIHFAELR